MIKTKVTRLTEYEHSVNLRVDTEINTTPELFVPEIASILKTAFERCPDMTLKAIELFMKEHLDDQH